MNRNLPRSRSSWQCREVQEANDLKERERERRLVRWSRLAVYPRVNEAARTFAGAGSGQGRVQRTAAAANFMYTPGS